MNVSGWCSPGPIGSIPDHDGCRFPERCDCVCGHGGRDAESLVIAGESPSDALGNAVQVWDNGTAALTANEAARATAAKRSSSGLTTTTWLGDRDG